MSTISARPGSVLAARQEEFNQRRTVIIELETRRKLIDALKEGGPRSRNVVIGIVGGLDAYNRIVRPMLAAGELVMKRARGGRIHLGRVT